ncbi:DUF4189 domain-containing protein [Nocardia sp. NPDC048505]|uniref:DUF4189 domain-containing protein n=1 Tax=unclassified Nocardia TaxID=2637762 RepID=UPI0033C53390
MFNKSIAAVALSVSAVSAAAVLAAPPAAADPVKWGAISLSVWGNVFAFSVNHPTEADAIRAADRSCKGQGIIDCRMMVTFANGCGAVVTSPLSIVAGVPILGFGKGATPAEADADAIRNLPTGTGSAGAFDRQHACTQP